MAFFKYKVRNLENQLITGLVEAPSPVSAAKLLKEKKFFIIEINEAKESPALTTILNQFKRVKFNDIVNFTRQMSTMINAGLQLPESLAILKEQTNNPQFSSIITDLEQQIMSGSNLADSLARYPQYFSDIYIALIRAGEASGMLDQVLKRLAENLESQQDFKNKIKGAMIYPAIILIAMGIVIFIMMTVVIPKLTEMYPNLEPNFLGARSYSWPYQHFLSISGGF